MQRVGLSVIGTYNVRRVMEPLREIAGRSEAIENAGCTRLQFVATAVDAS